MYQCCRICFAFDVKMHKFGDTVQRKFIANIFKQQGHNRGVSEYHYLCYICKALLSKSYNFMERALRAQQVFDGLLKQNDLVTSMNMLQKIDRCKLNLNYKRLSFKKINIGSVDEYEDNISVKVNIDADKNSLNKLNNRIADDGSHGCMDMKNDPFDNIDSVKSVKGCYNEDSSNENSDIEEIEIKFKDPCIIDVDAIDDPLDVDIIDESDAINIKTDMLVPKPDIQYNDNVHLELESNAVFVVNKIGSERKRTLNTVHKRKKKTKVVLESSSSQNLNKKKTQKEYKSTNKMGKPIKEKKIYKKCKPRKESLVDEINIITDKRRKRKMALVDSNAYDHEEVETVIKKNPKMEEDSDYEPDSSESVDSDCEREFPMTCDHCDSLISSKQEHAYHYMESHRNIKYPYSNTGFMYVCEICGAKSNSMSRFKSHLLKHGEKTIQCQECAKMYHTPDQLACHVTRVHGPRKYVCDHCGKRFPDKGAVKLHIRTHTGEKPYKCHICEAGFAHNGNRLLHIRVKHQNRPYPLQEKKEKENQASQNQKAENQESENQESQNQESENPESQNQKKKTKKRNQRRKRDDDSDDDTLATIRKRKKIRNIKK